MRGRSPQVGETWRARMVSHHWDALDNDSPDDGDRWLFRIVAEGRTQRKRYVLAAKCDWKTRTFFIAEDQAHWFACGNRETVGDCRFRLLSRVVTP